MATKHKSKRPKRPWVVDFYTTKRGTLPVTQNKAVYAETFLDYVTNLDIDSALPKKQLTSIICTIGPSSAKLETMEQMIKAGMRVARINMSFYNTQQCTEIIQSLKIACNSYSKKIGRIYSIAIVLDIKGAEVRTGNLKSYTEKDVLLEEGAEVRVTSDPMYYEHVTNDTICVDYENLHEVVQQDDEFFFDDRKVRLSVLGVKGRMITCRVENTGRITSRVLFEAPGVPIDLPYLSEKDIEDLKFCAAESIDAVIVPVTNREDIMRIREELGEEGRDVFIFSKITNNEAVRNIDDIISETDGIFLLRSRITSDLPMERYYMIQKSTIAKCNQLGMPVICAPQMLDSMAENDHPANAEIADVTNAVLDGADGILLSKETSVGKFPVVSVQALVAICKEAEAGVYQKQIFDTLAKFVNPVDNVEGIAMQAVRISMAVNAAAIIVTTTTGKTARMIAKYRPRVPILAVTRSPCVARWLKFFRAVEVMLHVKPSKMDWNKELMRRANFALTYGKYSGLIRTGDAVVMVLSPQPCCGFINSIKVIYASEYSVCKEK